MGNKKQIIAAYITAVYHQIVLMNIKIDYKYQY